MIEENSGFGEFEFERRFLVKKFPTQFADSPTLIVQNYFLADATDLPDSGRSKVSDIVGRGAGFAIRVRCQISNFRFDNQECESPRANMLELLQANRDQVDFAAITVKGPAAGGTRYESEREIDPGIGVELVQRGVAVVAKLRYSMWLGHDGWVVDVFKDDNAPLMIAECERASPVTDLEIPDFCFTEVTDDHRFANDTLALHPFNRWQAQYEVELAARGATFRQDFGINR
jgi:CYTH domain-containing protein